MLVKDENDNLVPLVDLTGRFLKGENVPELFSGKYIKNEYYDEGTAPEKSWDVELAILLKTENKAFKVENMFTVIRIVGELTNQFCIILWILGL
jgi:isoleucyl-tRNA synthetase